MVVILVYLRGIHHYPNVLPTEAHSGAKPGFWLDLLSEKNSPGSLFSQLTALECIHHMNSFGDKNVKGASK